MHGNLSFFIQSSCMRFVLCISGSYIKYTIVAIKGYFNQLMYTLQSFRSGNSRTRFMSKLWKRPYAPVKKGHRYMHFTGNIREYSERITTYTLNMVLVFHYYVKRFHSISKLWFGNLQKNALYEPYPEKC